MLPNFNASVAAHAVAWPTLVPEEPIVAGPLAVYPLLSPHEFPGEGAEPSYLLLEQARRLSPAVWDDGHLDAWELR